MADEFAVDASMDTDDPITDDWREMWFQVFDLLAPPGKDRR